jgi:polyvinyl alcohol dehydrogenase (cytochrome)
LRAWPWIAAAFAICTSVGVLALAQTIAPTGEAIYGARCAGCHDRPDLTRAPPKTTLADLPPATINFALTEGKMKTQGAGLSADDRRHLIEYLTGRRGSTPAAEAEDHWSSGMMCSPDRRVVDLKGPAPVTGFGYDRRNTRDLTAHETGLTKARMSDLELAWAIAIPGGHTMRTQPAIVGDTVFLPVADARAVYAFDVSKPPEPCVKWVYRTASRAPLRTSASYGVLANGEGVIAFSGFDTIAYLLDAKTGRAIWTKHVGTYPFSQATGTPVVLKDRIIVPMSQYEIVVGGDNRWSCCTEHGYVVSLNPRDGSQQWRYDTMEVAHPIRDRGDGKFLYGPSGAPIWTSPAIDEKLGLIFVGTGEANSPPVSKNTDAIIAIGLTDGKERWSLQGAARDIYLAGCGPHPSPKQLNCVADTDYRDVDFGASMILAPVQGVGDVVFGGQKSGTVWAVDPATGHLIWRKDLGSGSPLGGIHWGIAFADNTLYAPVTALSDDFLGHPAQPGLKPGMYALDARTGAVKWTFPTTTDCFGDSAHALAACARRHGLSAAPAVIAGTVVTGALDGKLYVLDAADGRLLWKFDTAIAYRGINGVAGKGGAIDGASISAGDGLLFVNSGYSMFDQTPGNVFLAFRPRSTPRTAR